MFRAALPPDSISMGSCSLVREGEQTPSVITEEPSSFMMQLSDLRRNAEAMSVHGNGRAPRLEPRTVSEVDDENGSGHALGGTADSKHVVPRACWARWPQIGKGRGSSLDLHKRVPCSLTPPCSAELGRNALEPFQRSKLPGETSLRRFNRFRRFQLS